MFCFAVRVFEQEKLRQQTAFISPPTEAGVFCENMINEISRALDIDHLRHGKDPAVIGAVYHIDSGEVEFLHTEES